MDGQVVGLQVSLPVCVRGSGAGGHLGYVRVTFGKISHYPKWMAQESDVEKQRELRTKVSMRPDGASFKCQCKEVGLFPGQPGLQATLAVFV